VTPQPALLRDKFLAPTPGQARSLFLLSQTHNEAMHWALHDIAIANIVWCVAYKRGVSWGVVYCALVVQWYCNRVGFASGAAAIKG